MADNPDALRVAVDGGKCYIANLGSAVPTGMDPFSSAWRDLGLISEEGVNEAYEEDRTERRPWGYKSPVRTDITGVTKTFTMTAWETNAYTRALYDNVGFADFSADVDGVVSYTVRRPTGQSLYMLAIDSFDGTNHLRTIVPRAEVTARGEMVNSAEEVIGYNFTWTAYELSDRTMFQRFFLSNGMWLPVDTLTVTGTATVAVAATTQLTATAAYFNDDADADVSADADWDTSDPAIATVDDTGEVTGVSAGAVTITATYRGVSGALPMTVTSP
ncbi:Ig-like domain-containing protein [Allonocardiopsis opalescens]|uniref:Ig-like protein group 2 n=1 Tax=Allonocardiopsis opalescens TaxID=1144618 RepID=A0A2T0PSW6_9ACTN|nr:Ig-like domain-containing protein [Allonocardiopsis opalescens]PRX91987.1 Ig-like protein group 2 [Allonocardiopsis opalescens]